MQFNINNHKNQLKIQLKYIIKACFYYERGMKHSFFLLFIFPRLKSKRPLSKKQ